MRKNTRKIFVFFLALCITCASISFPVYAGNGANKSVDSSAYIVVNGKTLYAFDYYNGTVTNTIDGLSYDENSNTLTLNNYDQPDSVITVNEMGEDFNIQVNGTNSILQLSVWGFGYGGSCYLKGSGSLTVNKKKSADIAIILNSEKSNSKFQVASSVILKAYSKSGNPVIGMDSSTCSTNGIYFEDTSFNKNVVAGSHTTDKTCTAVDTGEKWMLYACTRNNDATHTYGAQKRMTSDGQEYYVIFQITNDATYGNIAHEATDDYGNPLPESEFTIDSSDENTFYAIDASASNRKQFKVYTKNVSGNYGIYSAYYHENGQESGLLYSIYTLATYEDLLLAVPVADEQKISSIPAGYETVAGNTYYDYYYHAESLSTEKDPCAFGHTPTSSTQKATTSKSGKSITTCSVCKKKLAEVSIPKVSSIKLSSSAFTYNGKSIKPSVTVKDSKGRSLEKNTDYKITYSKGRKSVGQYTVKVTLKGSYYSGSKTLKFKILPKKTSLSSVKGSKKALNVKWKKQSTQTNGYQLQYSKNSNFKNAKTTTVTKNKTTSKKISKLSSKKKYYVRIRTYKNVKINGKNTKLYSSWSGKKSVKTK